MHRLHWLHRFHGFHWCHRLHPSDVLIRLFKRQFFRILQLRFASYRFDLITVNPDKLYAIFALKTENKVFAGPKQLRRLRPFASSKTGALILLLSRVTGAQSDLCVITVILNEEPLSFPISQAYAIRIFLYLMSQFLGGNRQPSYRIDLFCKDRFRLTSLPVSPQFPRGLFDCRRGFGFIE
jgi:hypothetical protein